MAYQTARERKEKAWTRDKWQALARGRGTAFMMGMKVTVQDVETGRELPNWGGSSVELSVESDFGAVLIIATPSAKPYSVCPRNFYRLDKVRKVFGAMRAHDADGAPQVTPDGVSMYHFLSPQPIGTSAGSGEPANSHLTLEIEHKARRVYVMIAPGPRVRAQGRAGLEDQKPQDVEDWQEDRRMERETLQLMGSLIMNGISEEAGGLGVDWTDLPIAKSVGRPLRERGGTSELDAPPRAKRRLTADAVHSLLAGRKEEPAPQEEPEQEDGAAAPAEAEAPERAPSEGPTEAPSERAPAPAPQAAAPSLPAQPTSLPASTGISLFKSKRRAAEASSSQPPVAAP
eukprot:TRINITY_DN20595_c0_g1_i1.p1 TRINITY_DN20595_c0_g1~~TRINITY_DN20595_c0_g1_i1.p1  ORF type:complete len:344 (+),score=96.96 TRINITY_DN20595_c0_g1_i1:85-1116(+)